MPPQFYVAPERSIETRATRRQDEGILLFGP